MISLAENSQKPVKPDWEALNAEYEASSETINEFCHRHGVKYSTFKENRKKYPKRKQQVSQRFFTPVQAEPLPERSSIVELEFPSGLKLKIKG